MVESIIIQGDCIKEMRKLEAESIDLVIVDPPYNIGVDYGSSKDKMKDYTTWCGKWVKQFERILKPNGSLYIINYPENQARLMIEIGRKTNLIHRSWITWHYPSNIGVSKFNFTRSQRTILFYTKGNKFKFNLEEGEVVEDWLEFNLVKNTSKEKQKGFPNQIPEKLIELLIGISSNDGDTVLDCFSGSGTTGAVSKRMNRNFIGIELNPDFIKIAEKRISEVKNG